MLEETTPAPIDTEQSAAPAIPDATPDDLLQLAISQFAKRLRRAGHVESAHFMDVAALALREQQRH